ncbi:uncharacterized protein HHUB_1173 [Halobacterium hubeiense]|uniref:Uncharacterized protein n=1 Tax=Halobacterium hubeiense TaxID=1407499 RepID=A0A0U5GYQ4_9EURY|nr:hypothetical protein [Halobacterium hubeiense]CQH45861.1 uncharacterized protein HHUB_1173 [Halobacterium hubeiense]
MSVSRKNLVIVFLVTLSYRLLFQVVNGFPLRPDFFQRVSVMKDIAAGRPYIQSLNPELFYQLGSLAFHLPVDPLWFFSIATIFVAALGITTVCYVTAEFFGQKAGLYAAFALVVMSTIPFKATYSWTINSYISAYVFLPLFLLTLFQWKRTEDLTHLLTGSILLLLIGGFHHLVFLEVIALLGFAFFLVDIRVILYAPAIVLNIGLMWQNYGQYLFERGVGLLGSITDRVLEFLSLDQGTSSPTSSDPPSSTGSSPPPQSNNGNSGSIEQFSDSTFINLVSQLSMLNPFVILTGSIGFIYGLTKPRERGNIALRILLAWVLAQLSMILFTHFVQPQGTERAIRHLFIPFAMVFGVGFEVVVSTAKQRLELPRILDDLDIRGVLLAIAVVLSIPMLAYQVAPFGGAGYVVHPDSELTDGMEKINVDGKILAPPLTNELVNYYHDGEVLRTYPRDFTIPDRERQTQAKAWAWWEDPANCQQLRELGVDWVFVDKRDYFGQYWNNPENVRVPQHFDQPYLEVEYENADMALYEVTACNSSETA